MTDLDDRFWSKVERPDDPAACWQWIPNPDGHGYGRIWLSGRTVAAHRVAYELCVGAIPSGSEIDHACRNRRCVNPAHLRAVTRKQNQENRAGATQRSKSGIRGVSWNSRDRKWEVRVQSFGRRFFGGLFTDLHEAEAAARDLRLRVFTHSDADRTEVA